MGPYRAPRYSERPAHAGLSFVVLPVADAQSALDAPAVNAGEAWFASALKAAYARRMDFVRAVLRLMEGSRWMAAFIDFVVGLWILIGVVRLPGFAWALNGGDGELVGIGLAVWAAYYALPTAATGRTVGKILTRTRVISSKDGGRPGFLHAFVRWLLEIPRAIPILRAAFANDDGTNTLDQACDYFSHTVVVREETYRSLRALPDDERARVLADWRENGGDWIELPPTPSAPR
jgi:uncharacterized RDD family membrane protein YckC